MRPVQYLWELTRDIVRDTPELSSAEILEQLKSNVTRKAFKKKYEYRDFYEELKKMFYELEHYGKVLKDTLFQCVYGEDGSLQYYHMCQECGNILHDPHDEWYVTEHDMMCPTCNGLDVDKYPFKTIKRGSMQWIHLVRSATFTDQFNEENPDNAGYIAGSAKGLTFTITPWMEVKWWLFVRWSRIKHIARIVRHPKKHIDMIRKRNKWRREVAGNDA